LSTRKKKIIAKKMKKQCGKPARKTHKKVKTHKKFKKTHKAWWKRAKMKKMLRNGIQFSKRY